MQVGPACYAPAPARVVSGQAMWFPLQNDLVVAKQPESYVSQADVPVPNFDTENGRRLFTMDPIKQATWMVVDVRPVGTLYFTAGYAPSVGDVSAGWKWTPARARIQWIEAGGIMQSVDVDIGAGVSFAVPPTNQVWVDLLVANENRESLDRVAIPETGFERAQWEGIRYGTSVSCKVTCVASPAITRACLTRFFWLGPTREPDGLAKTQDLTIPNGTRSVEFFTGQQGSAGPVSDPVLEPRDIIFRWESLPINPTTLASGASTQPVFPVPLTDLTIDLFPSGRFALEGLNTVDDTKFRTGEVAYPGAVYNLLRAQLANTEKRGFITAKFNLDI